HLPLLLFALSGVAEASLIDRGNGMIYDQDLNITWLADANYAQTSGYDADGLMDWQTATTWAADLTYGGYSDWRLPTTPYPDSSYGFNQTGSELGYMFYYGLYGSSGIPITTLHDEYGDNYHLFSNIHDAAY
ncbi:MAG: hypothetical protein ABL903_18150, partial [Methylococcales bacterium]